VVFTCFVASQRTHTAKDNQAFIGSQSSSQASADGTCEAKGSTEADEAKARSTTP
jgi:hypothetical protein